jgi:hypothetical protein
MPAREHLRIECCQSFDDLVCKAKRWKKIHGPKTRVYIDLAHKAVYLSWGRDLPQEGLIDVHEWLLSV